MLKRDITYENPFTGKEVIEEHYFHISKADLIEMEMEEHNATYEKDGEELTGMQAKLTRIVDSQDGRAIMAEFKDIIRRAYGRKEGERFIKSKEIQDDFLSSEAFSQLLWELCTKPDSAAEFIQGVVPHNLDKIAAEVQEQAAKITAGREAQATAKAAGTPEEVLAKAVAPSAVDDDPTGLTKPSPEAETSRSLEIANATPENPVTLTRAEYADLDAATLQTGLGDGRYKLS